MVYHENHWKSNDYRSWYTTLLYQSLGNWTKKKYIVVRWHEFNNKILTNGHRLLSWCVANNNLRNNSDLYAGRQRERARTRTRVWVVKFCIKTFAYEWISCGRPTGQMGFIHTRELNWSNNLHRNFCFTRSPLPPVVMWWIWKKKKRTEHPKSIAAHRKTAGRPKFEVNKPKLPIFSRGKFNTFNFTCVFKLCGLWDREPALKNKWALFIVSSIKC